MKKIVALLLAAVLMVSTLCLVSCKEENKQPELTTKEKILNALDEKKLTESVNGDYKKLLEQLNRATAETLEVGVDLEVDETSPLADILAGKNGIQLRANYVNGAFSGEANVTLGDDAVDANLVFVDGNLYFSIPDGFDGFVFIPVESMLPTDELSESFSVGQITAPQTLFSGILKYARRLVELLPDTCFDVEGGYLVKISAAELKTALTAVQSEMLADESFKKDLTSVFGEEILEVLGEEVTESADLSLKATTKDDVQVYEFVLSQGEEGALRAVVNVGKDSGDFDIRVMTDGENCAATFSGTFKFGETYGFTLKAVDGTKTENNVMLEMAMNFDKDGNLTDGTLSVYQDEADLHYCAMSVVLSGKADKSLEIRVDGVGYDEEAEKTMPVFSVTGTVKAEADGFSADLEISVPISDGVDTKVNVSGSVKISESSLEAAATVEMPAFGLTVRVNAKETADETLPAVTAPEGATELDEEAAAELLATLMQNMMATHPVFFSILSMILGGDSGIG